MDERRLLSEPSKLKRLRRVIGAAGIVVAAGILLWIPAGFVPGIPGPLDVYGIEGLRKPASFMVGGLMLGAIGFFEP